MAVGPGVVSVGAARIRRHRSSDLVDRAGNASTQAEVEALFADVTLPVYK